MGDLTRNFSRHEFACKCGCGYDTVDVELVREYLQPLRDHFGPCTVTSGCRCLRHNASIPGAFPNSMHLYARAADVRFERGTPEQWGVMARSLGAPGVGVYSNRVHIDSRTGEMARWSA